jgi:hypothetical protein
VRYEPDPADLERSRGLRVARQRLEKLGEYEALLRRAAIVRKDAGQIDDSGLQDLIQQAHALRSHEQLRVEGRVFPRRRPKARATDARDSCFIFLDECGAHQLASVDTFPVFCLAATVVRERDYPGVDLQFRAWKARSLASEDFVVHEPDIRNKLGPWRNERDGELLEGLRQLLASLEYVVVASVLRRQAYIDQWGEAAPDDSLPHHPYLMSLDFLFERIVMVLERAFHGGKAKVVAESRGPKEDALLQYEFARLQLEGTAYISAAWFRQQLHPGIHFEGKGGGYATGLQLADLAARPIAEKVASPATRPDRWEEIRGKLAQGVETKNSVLGLKILPWDPAFADLWKS